MMGAVTSIHPSWLKEFLQAVEISPSISNMSHIKQASRQDFLVAIPQLQSKQSDLPLVPPSKWQDFVRGWSSKTSQAVTRSNAHCGMGMVTDVLQHTPTGKEEAGSAWIWAEGCEMSSQQKDASSSSIPSQHASDAVPEDSDVVQTSWIEKR